MASSGSNSPGVGQEESDRAVVCVDHDLDAVAQVVHAAEAAAGRERLRIRIAVAERVGIPDPAEPALRADQVGIPVVGQEGSDLRHALLDGAAEEDL
jgi:hypothetical protein